MIWRIQGRQPIYFDITITRASYEQLWHVKHERNSNHNQDF